MIPIEAMPVVEILRKDVKKPEPFPHESDDDGTGLRFIFGGTQVCPMGLHIDSKTATPVESFEFANGICSEEAVKAFYEWWDSQKDIVEALNEIWPLTKENINGTQTIRIESLRYSAERYPVGREIQLSWQNCSN